MVSELLGSFSDNELSPECLDGAQDFLQGNLTCPSHNAHSVDCSRKFFTQWVASVFPANTRLL